MVTLALFAILFCWVSAGFWTAMAGFLVLLRGGDRYMISRYRRRRSGRPADRRRCPHRDRDADLQ